MKKLLTLLILLLTTIPTFSQNSQLKIVGKPKIDSSEIIGRKDVNSKTCAGIIVISDLDGFTYDSYNGIEKLDDRPGRDVIFLQANERVLEIYHAGYEPLKIILSEEGISLKEGEAWKITIQGEKVSSEILPVTILVEPKGASISIDAKDRGTAKQHQLSLGNHKLRISKTGYEPINKTILVEQQNTLFEYKLKEVQDVTLQLTTEPKGATVFIDGVKFGETPLSDFYPSGKYPIKIEKEQYVTFEDFIEITPPETRENYKLKENWGSLKVSSSPESSLEIYLNGEAQNVKTPYTFDRLKPETYRVSAKSEFYETDEQTVKIERGKSTTASLTTEGNFATLTIKTLEGTTVYLNDKQTSQLTNLKLEPQVLRVRVEMPPKAKAVEERVVLKKGDNLTVEVFPEIPLGTLQVAVVPFEAKVELKGDGGEFYTSVGSKIFKDIPVGTYILTVKADKHKTHTEILKVKEDESTKVKAVLKEGSDLPIPSGMIFVEGGTFQMGSNNGDSDEKPVHTVTVGDFYIGATEVTQKEYREIMGKNPSYFKGDNNPVEKVSWYDAVKFCNEKSKKEGRTPCYRIDGKNVTCDFSANGYRLPTEAEWEFAARGGNKSKGYKFSGSNNLDEVGWYDGNSNSKTHAVGQKKSNELGIFDMSGNVWEWCWDWYENYSSSSQQNPKGSGRGSIRVLRGGSWFNDASGCRVAERNRFNPSDSTADSGFRLVSVP